MPTDVGMFDFLVSMGREPAIYLSTNHTELHVEADSLWGGCSRLGMAAEGASARWPYK